MADSGGSRPPDTKSHLASGKVDTKPMKAERTQQIPNVPCPDSVTGRRTVDSTSRQAKDEPSESAESASGFMQKVPGKKTPPKNKTKKPEFLPDCTQDFEEQLRSDKQFAKQNKDQQITGADDVQQMQTFHPGIRRKAAKEDTNGNQESAPNHPNKGQSKIIFRQAPTDEASSPTVPSLESVPHISPEYRLEQVERTYILHSKIHKPVKVTQLNGKFNVSVEGSYILIEDDIVYLISYEYGNIIISKVEEAKVEENQTCSPSSITNDHHNGKEIQCKSEVKPNKEEKFDSEIEKLTDTIKQFVIEDTKGNQESAPKHPNKGQSKIIFRQAPTDEASSPTVPARNKAIEWIYKNEGSMTVKSGEPVLLEMTFKGQEPHVSCLFNGGEHPDKNRTSIQIKDGKIVYQLDNVVPLDNGKYTLTAENKTGNGIVSTLLKVLDKPSPPRNLNISDITSESCRLHWQKPDHENGSSITKYTVQMCVSGEEDWKDTCSSTTTETVVNGLQTGTEYHFRVAAENEVGAGAFQELPVPLTTKDRLENREGSHTSESSSLCPVSEDEITEDEFDTQHPSIEPLVDSLITEALVQNQGNGKVGVLNTEQATFKMPHEKVNPDQYEQKVTKNTLRSLDLQLSNMSKNEFDGKIKMNYIEMINGKYLLHYGENMKLLDELDNMADVTMKGNIIFADHDVYEIGKDEEGKAVLRKVENVSKMPKRKGKVQGMDNLAKKLETKRLQPLRDELACIADGAEQNISDKTQTTAEIFLKQGIDTKTYEDQACVKKLDDSVLAKERKPMPVCVVGGKLHEFMADVLVNSTSPRLDLNNGAVSHSLSSTAGEEMQRECRMKYKNGIEYGNVAVTSGYKLKCKKVFHGALQEYKTEHRRVCLQTLENFVLTCLKKASDLNLRSIAFPAIGTGKLNYPIEKVAEVMFSTVTQFMEKGTVKDKMLDVYFVIYPVESTSVFTVMHREFFKAPEKLQGSQEVLMPDRQFDNYIKVQNIPSHYTKQDLADSLEKLTRPPKLIFCDNKTTALLLCDTQNDADILDGCLALLPLTFKKLRVKSHPRLQKRVDTSFVNKAKENNKFDDFLRELNDAEIQVITYQPFVLEAPTSFQLQFVNITIEKYNNSFTKDSEFEGIVKIENVTESVWDVVRHSGKYSSLKSKCKDILWLDGTVTVDRICPEDKDLQAFKEKIQALNKMESYDKCTDGYKTEEIRDWIDSIHDSIGYDCCTFLKEKQKIIVFCKMYEDILRFKYLFAMKAGEFKPTARRRKHIVNNAYEEFSHLPIEQTVMQHSRRAGNDSADFSWKDYAKHLRAYTTIENIKVYVYEANILMVPVDCIVNAANERLQHSDGVAAVIAKAAGPQMKEADDNFLKHNLKLPVGIACKTAAGNLRYSFVVHTVGPDWSHYHPHTYKDVERCEQDLYMAIYNSFLVAESNNAASIALPAISSAIFQVPEELCVYQYAKATLNYSRKSADCVSHLKEIHFIDKNKDIVRKTQQMFDVWLLDKKIPDYDRLKYVKKTSKDRGHRSDFRFSGGKHWRQKMSLAHATSNVDGFSSQADLPCPLSFESGWNSYTFLFCATENQTLNLSKRDIFDIRASAILITINEKGLSGSIGLELKSQMHSFKHNYTQTVVSKVIQKHEGDVFLTDGFSCSYEYILHAVCSRSSRRGLYLDRQSKLMETYSKVFDLCKSIDGIESIIMTLIDVDINRDEEIQMCSEAFLDSYLNYCLETGLQSRSPLAVHLVCYNTHVLDVTKSVLHAYVLEKKEEIEKQKIYVSRDS